MQILLAAAFLIAPAGLIYLAHHKRWAARVGVIVLCYGLGMAIGSAGLIPPAAASVPQVLSELTIVLALPLLLFTLDIRQWSQVAGKALLSMLVANVVVVGLATSLFLTFRDQAASEAANLAAMSVGVYTGGTPNLAAIKTGLEIPNAEYLVFHSLDTIVGSFYFLFMLTLGVPLFRRLLPGRLAVGEGGAEAAPGADQDDYRPLLKRANLQQALVALMLAVVVVALAAGVSELLAMITGGARNSAVLIVALTTLGIVLSLHDRVRTLLLSYRLGMYLIYIFCIAVSSMVNFGDLAAMDVMPLVFLLVVVFVGLSVHALFCRLIGVDSDTFMVTSVAAVTSPPFVPLMARALGNPAAMLPGMTTGVIGYALGSYLGISLGLYLHSL
ncbi:MAG: DUF819 domain-containing protein [Halioglobus sp.]